MYRSAIEQRVAAAETALRLAVDGLDPDDIPAGEAVRLFDGLERIARTATAARTMLARRVEDSMEWKRLGYGSAAEHIADQSGKGLGADGPARRADRGTRRSLATIRPIMARPARVAGSPSVGASVAAAAPDQPNLFGYTRPPGRIGRPSMVDPSHQCDQRAQSQPLGHACKSASMSRTVDVRADDGTSCRPEGSMR